MAVLFGHIVYIYGQKKYLYSSCVSGGNAPLGIRRYIKRTNGVRNTLVSYFALTLTETFSTYRKTYTIDKKMEVDLVNRDPNSLNAHLGVCIFICTCICNFILFEYGRKIIIRCESALSAKRRLGGFANCTEL